MTLIYKCLPKSLYTSLYYQYFVDFKSTNIKDKRGGNLLRSDIFDEINRLENEMDLICNTGSRMALVPNEEAHEISRIPLSNVYETENSVMAAFEIPGVEKEDIQLNVTEDSIEVKVEKKAETESESKEYNAYEIRRHRFYTLVTLPAEVIAENADANYKNGILRVEIPKAKKQEQKKRIEVK